MKLQGGEVLRRVEPESSVLLDVLERVVEEGKEQASPVHGKNVGVKRDGRLIIVLGVDTPYPPVLAPIGV